MKERAKERYDGSIRNIAKFALGDKVLVKAPNPNNLDPKWEGPCEVIRVGFNENYLIRKSGSSARAFASANGATGQLTEPLPSYSGLFFKNEGTIYLSDESWKLVIYRDLRPLFIAKDSLVRLATKFHFVSTQYNNFTHIETTKSFLKLNLEKIENRLAELNMYLGKNSRQKRELLDGLSVVLKWLIGTPDAKDAMHYEDCINQLEKRETDLSSLMLEQTQIISSTVKTFNESILKITYDELIINENIERLNNYLNSSQSLLFSLKASQDVSAISLQILESVVNLENEINECLTSILFAKSNTIHPSIITLEKLYKELLLSNHIRTNKHLVSTVSPQNIHTILESSSLSAYVYSDKLVYILTFPLIQNDPLDLYHVYSIPIKHPNSSLHTTILPEHVYLAANPSGQTYVSTSSLETCKTYASEKQVCTGLVAYDATARPLCELQILQIAIPTDASRSSITASQIHLDNREPTSQFPCLQSQLAASQKMKTKTSSLSILSQSHPFPLFLRLLKDQALTPNLYSKGGGVI
ncbi:uncharacterized protein LOC133528455 [Cydia pomonella]|uniref:uncharacterized protein LOC133528455 n=1 Tax=Cydia pomonella TaxID=82600 RepID=UPI002ADD4507|nr:uncharacterized protein LOC133528455 [Cydia pomonella]